MGFGIALLGYACLILNEVGGAVLAAPLLAYGFFLASRLNRAFLYAAVSSLVLLPRGVVQLLYATGLINPAETPALNTVTFFLYMAAWLAMSFFWLSAVKEIAAECGEKKLERKAGNRLYFTAAFILFACFSKLIDMVAGSGVFGFSLVPIEYLLQYATIIINILFLHTCFILITSERQDEEDKHYIALEKAREREKRMKEQKEEAERLARKKKK